MKLNFHLHPISECLMAFRHIIKMNHILYATSTISAVRFIYLFIYLFTVIK